MQIQDFVPQLDKQVASHELLCHPFYNAWSRGQLTRNDLREYASDYYHHVAAFPTYLSRLHSRLEHGAVRRAVLNNMYEEELAGRSHAEMWLDFAEGMGADRAEVAARRPIASVAELIANFREVARNGSLAEALAAFYAYESQIPRIAKEKARGLKEMYNADEKTCSYFTLHTFADVRHAQVWRELLEAEVANAPDLVEPALASAERTAQWLWSALDGMESRRMAAVA